MRRTITGMTDHAPKNRSGAAARAGQNPARRRGLAALPFYLKTTAIYIVMVVGVGYQIERTKIRALPGWLGTLDEVGIFVSMCCCIMAGVWVARRERYPRRALAVAAVCSTLGAIGPVVGFLLPRYLAGARAQGRRRRALGVCAMYALITAWQFARELTGKDYNSSWVMGFLNHQNPLDDFPNNIGPLLVLYAVAVLLPIGWGLWRSATAELQETHDRLESTSEELEASAAASEELETQLTRKEERDALAREIHDSIGSQLAIMSLQAGSLELLARGDADLEEAARSLRESSRQATDDLRSLVRVMRDPSSSAYRPPRSLTELADHIDKVLAAGHPVVANVFITDAERAPAALTTACYRIVQELLTNAVKYAPEETTRVRVSGGPDQGLDIAVRNAMPAAHESEPGESSHGTGSGLRGVQARAQALGGRASFSTAGGVFAVDVHLPWDGSARGGNPGMVK